MNTTTNRVAALATAAVIALTSVGLSPTTAPAATKQTRAADRSEPIEFGSRHRYYRRGDAAALGAFAAIVGTVAAVAIAEKRRREWRRYGYPYGHPYRYRYYGHPYGYDRY
jgi:hypothetical protein